VKALQVQLNKYKGATHGNDLPISGYLGPKTQAALYFMQGQPHVPLGYADVNTWHLLMTESYNGD
jgi:hypothetical protein